MLASLQPVVIGASLNNQNTFNKILSETKPKRKMWFRGKKKAETGHFSLATLGSISQTTKVLGFTNRERTR